MKRVCAHCKKDLGEKEGPADRVSHGICPECLKIVYEEIANFNFNENPKRRSYGADKAQARIC